MNDETGLVARASPSFGILAALAILLTGIAAADGVDRDGSIITTGPPIYPEYCFRKHLQGYVDFVFSVDLDGLIRDPSVEDVVVFRKNADHPAEDEKAKRAFILAATTALGNFRYEPPIKNGHIVEMKGVQTRITFKIGH